MSESRRHSFRGRAADELGAEVLPAEMTGHIVRKLVEDSAAMLARGPADAQARAQSAREFAVANLEDLHAGLRESMQERGVRYHRAGTAEEAAALVTELLGNARRVAKSKTMVGEEIGLTPALRDAGIDVLETDIGEYIVDIEGRGPSHITAPALHLNRVRIRELLSRGGAELPDDDPTRLSQFVRDQVGAYFADCDAAITGANGAVAASGRLLVVENEGNVSLGLSHPRKHIVVTGLEKVVAADEDALALIQVLAPSATAQPLTAFTHLTAAPPPGQERHVVFVDNGRSQVAADSRYRDVLRCIRCGACMNACPVYRVAGGLAYGSAYMGPIGAVVSPLLWTDGDYSDLPGASTLCGRCTEVCPVGIPLHRMLLDLRGDEVERSASGKGLAWRAWATAYGGGLRAKAAGMLASRAAPLGARLAGERLPLGAAERARTPGALQDAGPPRQFSPSEPPSGRPEPGSLADLFRSRATALGVHVVAESPAVQTGEVVVDAAAAVASTGSVLLTAHSVDRRRLLASSRIVVRVRPGIVVHYPADLLEFLAGHDDALILTGASRTADIEKQIVTGIHGPENLIVVFPREGA